MRIRRIEHCVGIVPSQVLIAKIEVLLPVGVIPNTDDFRSIKQLKAVEQELEEAIAPLRDLYDQFMDSLRIRTLTWLIESPGMA